MRGIIYKAFLFAGIVSSLFGLSEKATACVMDSSTDQFKKPTVTPVNIGEKLYFSDVLNNQSENYFAFHYSHQSHSSHGSHSSHYSHRSGY